MKFDIDPPPENILEKTNDKILEIFLNTLISAGATDKTVKSYRAAIMDFLNFIGNKPLREISISDVNKWKSYRLKKGFDREKTHDLSEVRKARLTTLHYYTLFLRGFFQWLKLPVKVGIAKAPPRHMVNTLSLHEILRLLEASRDILDVVIVRFLLETGLRAEEALNVKVSDVDFERCEVKVRRGKFGSFRVVFFSKDLSELLKTWIKVKRLKREDKIIPLSYVGLWKRLKSLAKRAGINSSKVRPHVFRHTFATEALKKGMDVITLKNILGHSDVKITQIYTHLVKEDLREKYFRIFKEFIPSSNRQKSIIKENILENEGFENCPGCKRTIPLDAIFCPYCGFKLKEKATW